MKRSVMEMGFFVFLILAGVTLLFFIFKPYLFALFMGLIFAIIFDPVHQSWCRLLKGKETISSLITVFLVLVVILIPLFVLGAVLVQEAKDATIQLQQVGGAAAILPSEGKNIDVEEYGNSIVNVNKDATIQLQQRDGATIALFLEEKIVAIEKYVNDLAPDSDFDINLYKFVENGVSWIAKNLDVLFSEFAKGTINLFLVIISLFFFLRDGEKMKKTVVKWSPLDDKYDKRILDKMTTAVNSVVKGSLLIAIIQGFLSGIGFVIFGVPSPVLWGFVATIAALIPSVGTGLILIPAVLYLYFSSAPLWAIIGLVVWGVGVVGLVDNFLRPILIEKGIKIHPFLILLSVFGGISFFGPIGFLAGPITLSFVFALIEVCPSVLKNRSESS